MPKIKILYVITKLELGGAQKQLLSLIKNIDKNKYAVCLFTARHGFLWPEARSLAGVECAQSYFLDRPLNPLFDILAFFELLVYIVGHTFDIVHTHSSKAGIIGRCAARCAGVKAIYHTVHGWSFNDFQSPWVRALYAMLERITGSFTTGIIVVSEYDKRRGLKARIAAPDRYALIRYGVDAAAFEKKGSDLRQGLLLAQNKIVVGMIACFKPQKAIRDFITVAREVCATEAHVVFILVGDGRQRRAIEDMILAHHLDGRVILLGWRSDIANVMNGFDIFMLTSLWEGLPIAVIEAMAASRPVIVTNTGGIAELIEDNENGFLVPVKDTQAMAAKLKVLLQNAGLRQQFGQKGRDALSSAYTTQHMVNMTCRFYGERSLYGNA